MGYLDGISRFGWPDDYVAKRLATLPKLGGPDTKTIAAAHIHPERMILLVVGDKARILAACNSSATAR
jgi:hypothetical protein